MMYNSVIYHNNEVENISSSMDVLLKKRYYLIPNLVSPIKEYMKYERDILEEITKLRTKVLDSSISEDEKSAAIKKMDKFLHSILLSVENYPELKTN